MKLCRAIVALILGFDVGLAARAAEPSPPDAGVVPLAPLQGDFWTRPVLTSDWGGARADLAQKGVQFDLGFTQVVQSVVDGGSDTDTRYGGNLDLVVNIDLMRIGVLPGAFVKLRAESRYGQSVNGIAGPVLPVNTMSSFPLAPEIDDAIPLVLTDLTYYQFFSKEFGVFVGKFDVLDADPNEFASARGVKQFMNANFVFSPAIAVAAPYSTLGGGVVITPGEHWTITSSIYATTDSSRSSGFETLDDGWSWASEVDLQYGLGRLPGGVNLGGIYSWDNDFTRLGGRFTFTPGQGFRAPTKGDTWSLYLSGWQYLFAEGEAKGAVRAGDGRPDLKGLGLFYRLGIGDSSTDLIDWAGSIGLGGRALIPGRDEDTWGVGYYYFALQKERLLSRVGLRDYSQGLEIFYNIHLAGWARFTIDFQVTDDPLPNTETAYIVGGRLELRF